ncbi:hypothetical protein B0J18DRAFT_435365 [Chaetomium sp. MPI-SDFR-AT-0129]|nr:hypothetical protein B0J18DRAFT_435365 [Chaetomium sp. MPI-SDFR-AT-0129]
MASPLAAAIVNRLVGFYQARFAQRESMRLQQEAIDFYQNVKDAVDISAIDSLTLQERIEDLDFSLAAFHELTVGIHQAIDLWDSLPPEEKAGVNLPWPKFPRPPPPTVESPQPQPNPPVQSLCNAPGLSDPKVSNNARWQAQWAEWLEARTLNPADLVWFPTQEEPFYSQVQEALGTCEERKAQVVRDAKFQKFWKANRPWGRLGEGEEDGSVWTQPARGPEVLNGEMSPRTVPK